MVSTSLEMKLVILFHLKISIMGGKKRRSELWLMPGTGFGT